MEMYLSLRGCHQVVSDTLGNGTIILYPGRMKYSLNTNNLLRTKFQ